MTQACDRLVGAIDGQRTLAEIFRFVAQNVVGEGQALGFFERLWQYDQVVFDASRARREGGTVGKSPVRSTAKALDTLAK